MDAPLYIVWKKNYEVGVPIIDEQHRGIISTINSLHYFIQSGLGDEIIGPTMITLEQYVNVHFTTEEALITEAGYPALAGHLLLHKTFRERTKKFAAGARKTKGSKEVLKFLKEWRLDHINKEDRKYISYLLPHEE